MLLSRRTQGACMALIWDEPLGLYRCGALQQPRQVLQSALPRWLQFLLAPMSAVLARLAQRWIAAGRGCDSDLDAQTATDIADNAST
jgi:hypothetical protein